MNREPTARRTDARLYADALSAALSVGLVGPWFRPTGASGWQALLAAAAVALISLLWLHRARFARQWKAALEAYAAREIARGRRGNAPPL